MTTAALALAAVRAEPAADGAFEELTRRSNRELDRIFESSPAPAPSTFVGWEWRGYNTPRWTRLAGIQKFIKGFFEEGGGVEGYNLRVPQNGIRGPWTPMPTPEAPSAFGFFTVTQPDSTSTLLDYGASRRNRWWRPDDVTMRVLRDYMVVPDARTPDVMLGKAIVALGPFRIFSNYFVIERLRPAVWQPPRPLLPR